VLPPHPFAWVHPILAALTTALAFFAASLGFRARRAPAKEIDARLRHARLAPRMYVLVLVNWAIGLATVWWLRPDDLAASGHFAVGSGIVAILSAGAALSLRVPTDARARAIHPVLGAVALVLFGVQVFLGLQLLP
jgi:hypothetical protein